MTSLVLGTLLAFFSGVSLHQLSLQATSRHKPIAFGPEGSPVDRPNSPRPEWR